MKAPAAIADGRTGADLHPLTLHFHDGALELRYRAAEDGKAVRMWRITLLASVATFLGAALVARTAPEKMVGIDLDGIAAIACVQLLAAFAVTFLPMVRRHPQAAVAGMAVLGAYGLVSLLRIAPVEFVHSRGFLFALLHVMNIASLLRLRLVPATSAAVATVGIHLAVVGLSPLAPPDAVLRHAFWLVNGTAWAVWTCYQLDARNRREFAAREALDRERARAESLLLNILPAAIAARLKDSQEPIAEHCDEVTVLFADIVGFTALSARSKPSELVALLDSVFTLFDALAREHGLEKIKTIGDAYMAVSGLPHAQPDHAQRAGRMAMAIVQAMQSRATATGEALQVRVGLHTGPVVAGVIGRSKFSYDLWGDTVNTASRMESLGLPGQVQCSPATAQCLAGSFVLRRRGTIEVKGKGPMETFLLGA